MQRLRADAGPGFSLARLPSHRTVTFHRNLPSRQITSRLATRTPAAGVSWTAAKGISVPVRARRPNTPTDHQPPELVDDENGIETALSEALDRDDRW